jgi:hypothetical protein
MMCRPKEGLVVIRKRAVPRTYRVNSCGKGIQIDKEIYTSGCESAHTSIVVSARVNIVYSNGVRAKNLHRGGIKLALSPIDQRIVIRQLICKTCRAVSCNREEGGTAIPLM